MITSTSNAKVRWLLKLQQKRKMREAEGLFIVEGLKMFEETPKNRLREIYVSESFYEKHKDELKRSAVSICESEVDQLKAGESTIDKRNLGEARVGESRIEILSEHVFAHVSDTKTPQGILCVVEMVDYTLEQMLEKKPAHILILEDVRDPGNVGTILRSAEGAGVTGVLLSANCVDMYNPKVIRSTMGSVYRVPFLYVESLKETIANLKEQNICIYATNLEGTEYYADEQYREGLAFMLGNEAKGLLPETAKLADAQVKIPMQGRVESLNVAIAASIFMFEVCRQRR